MISSIWFYYAFVGSYVRQTKIKQVGERVEGRREISLRKLNTPPVNCLWQVDCVIFGHLCQVVFVDFPYFHKEAVDDKVRAYLERVRDALWPDWYQRVVDEPFAD